MRLKTILAAAVALTAVTAGQAAAAPLGVRTPTTAPGSRRSGSCTAWRCG
jgi:hypothetical protein